MSWFRCIGPVTIEACLLGKTVRIELGLNWSRVLGEAGVLSRKGGLTHGA